MRCRRLRVARQIHRDDPDGLADLGGSQPDTPGVRPHGCHQIGGNGQDAVVDVVARPGDHLECDVGNFEDRPRDAGG